jgi:hypothetical protein
MAEETGAFLNQAITEGARNKLGIGAAVGQAILRARLPHRRLSILATGARLGIPVTSHIAIGTDIIHMHPRADGEALGAGSMRDFHTLVSQFRICRDSAGSFLEGRELGPKPWISGAETDYGQP